MADCNNKGKRLYNIVHKYISWYQAQEIAGLVVNIKDPSVLILGPFVLASAGVVLGLYDLATANKDKVIQSYFGPITRASVSGLAIESLIAQLDFIRDDCTVEIQKNLVTEVRAWGTKTKRDNSDFGNNGSITTKLLFKEMNKHENSSPNHAIKKNLNAMIRYISDLGREVGIVADCNHHNLLYYNNGTETFNMIQRCVGEAINDFKASRTSLLTDFFGKRATDEDISTPTSDIENISKVVSAYLHPF